MMQWTRSFFTALARADLFLRLLFSRFIDNQGFPHAASLTFTTLLSLVPLMTVVLAIFAAFPVSERVADQIEDFVFQNFVPAAGEAVQQYLREFSNKASKLTGAGFAFLLLTALLLMANIDRAINIIWRVRRQRSPVSMFLMYWSILSLGPLLIGVSVAATSYLVSMPLFSDPEALELRSRLLEVMPIVSSAVAFTLLYLIVPNRRVPLLHALAGGVLAAVLFELTKQGFALYLTHFPNYQAIYGALAVIPIFLVWIYLSWLVTLLGAEFSYCLGDFRHQVRHGEDRRGQNLLLTYHLLRELWNGQKAGQAMSTATLVDVLGRVSEERMEQLLERLRDLRLVHLTDRGDWVLARDLSDVSLLDLYSLRAYVLPAPELLAASEDPSDQALKQVLLQVDADLQRSMDVPLDSLYSAVAHDPARIV